MMFSALRRNGDLSQVEDQAGRREMNAGSPIPQRRFSMIRNFSMLKRSMLVALFILVPAVAVKASAETKEVRADVPFAFVVNHTHLPAGHYRVYADDMLLKIVNEESGKTEVVLLARNEEGRDSAWPGKLEFYVSGNRHVLTEVRFGGTGTRAILLQQPKRERVVASSPEAAGQEIGISTR
jgi:hypothetical protein